MVFFFNLAALLFERWFGGPPAGVYNSFLLTTKYVKRSLLAKSLNLIFDFQLAALALKNNHSVIHYMIQISWKIPLDKLNEIILQLKTSLSQPYEKVYSFRSFRHFFSICLLIVEYSHSAHPPFLLEWGEGGGGGLTGRQFLEEGLLGKSRVTFFRRGYNFLTKNKLKSGMFNDKKSL